MQTIRRCLTLAARLIVPFCVCAVWAIMSADAGQSEGSKTTRRAPKIQTILESALGGEVREPQYSGLEPGSTTFYIGAAIYLRDEKQSKFVLMRSDGRVEFEKKHHRIFGHLCNDGRHITLIKADPPHRDHHDVRYQMEVVNSRGQTTFEMPLEVRQIPSDGYPHVSNGGHIVGDSPDRVIYYDGRIVRRNEAWKEKLGPIIGWRLLPNGDILAYDESDVARINLEGRLLWRGSRGVFPTGPEEEHIAFEPRYFVRQTHNRREPSLHDLELVDPATGASYWKVHKGTRSFSILSFALSRSGKYIALVESQDRPQQLLMIGDTERRTILFKMPLPKGGLGQLAFCAKEDHLFAQATKKGGRQPGPMKLLVIDLKTGGVEVEYDLKVNAEFDILACHDELIIRTDGTRLLLERLAE